MSSSSEINKNYHQKLIKIRHKLFKQEVKHYCPRSTNSLTVFGIRKACLISGSSLLSYQFTKGGIKLIVVIIVGYHWYQIHTKCYWISFSQGSVHTKMKLLGIISVGFDVTDQLLIRLLAFIRDWRRKMVIQCDSISSIHRLQESLRFSEEGNIVQYSLRVWGNHEINLADKICLNETYRYTFFC
jgi:hypothetical protein